MLRAIDKGANNDLIKELDDKRLALKISIDAYEHGEGGREDIKVKIQNQEMLIEALPGALQKLKTELAQKGYNEDIAKAISDYPAMKKKYEDDLEDLRCELQKGEINNHNNMT